MMNIEMIIIPIMIGIIIPLIAIGIVHIVIDTAAKKQSMDEITEALKEMERRQEWEKEQSEYREIEKTIAQLQSHAYHRNDDFAADMLAKIIDFD